MNIVCVEVREFEEIMPELKDVLEQLRDDFIGDALLWI